MFFCCDDIGNKYRDCLVKLDDLKRDVPDLKVNCFVIAIGLNSWFKEWFLERQSWIEIGVHGYDHDYPPECERPDRRERIALALDVLRFCLPERYGFRAPGFQMTASTYPVLKELGFVYIAHQSRIHVLDDVSCHITRNVIQNVHIYDPVLRIRDKGISFERISETLCDNACAV